MPCTDCGASVDRMDPRPHYCHRERLLDYRMFALRHEIERFEDMLTGYLDSSAGRFESFLAARDVRAGRS
jgi:hypothetical protein